MDATASSAKAGFWVTLRGFAGRWCRVLGAGAGIWVLGRLTQVLDRWARDNGDIAVPVEERLLAASAQAAAQDSAALVQASGRGHAAVVEQLLEAGASAQDLQDSRDLVQASKDGDVAVVERLLAAGVKANTWDGKALHHALSRGHNAIVHRLMAAR